MLSFHGKALVVNALALSRVWYVASLIHMPSWVLKELSSLAFSFFWSGKRELVSRSTVVQCSLFGGFAVVDVKLKVLSLLRHLRGFFLCLIGLVLSLMPPLLMYFLIHNPIALGSSYRFTNLSCKPGVVWMVLFLSLIILSCMVFLHVIFVPLFFLCPPKLVMSFCFLRTWSHRIALKSLRPRLVSFIRLLRGALFLSLIWTVKFLT